MLDVHHPRTIFIYALADPRFSDSLGHAPIRYVGKSTNPKKRFTKHCNECSLPPIAHSKSWIKGVLDSGRRPELIILEECSEETWEDAEKFWISYLRWCGLDLVNATEGGGGINGITEETRAKISERVGNAHRGKKKSPEHAAKLRENLRKATAAALNPATRAKQSAAAKRRGVPIERIRAAQKIACEMKRAKKAGRGQMGLFND